MEDGRRARNRPRIIWIDEVEDDLKQMGVGDRWTTMVHDRRRWSTIAMKAKEIAWKDSSYRPNPVNI